MRCGTRGVRAGPRCAASVDRAIRSRDARGLRAHQVHCTPTLAERPRLIAVSPDGSRIAFLATRNGRSRLWVRTLGSRGARDCRDRGRIRPFWSPDSRWIGFLRQAMEGRCGRRRAGSAVRADLCGGGTGQRQRHPLFVARVIQQVSASAASRSRSRCSARTSRHMCDRHSCRTPRFAAPGSVGSIHLGTPIRSEHSILLPGEQDSGLNISFSREHVLFLRGPALMARKPTSAA